MMMITLYVLIACQVMNACLISSLVAEATGRCDLTEEND